MYTYNNQVLYGVILAYVPSMNILVLSLAVVVAVCLCVGCCVGGGAVVVQQLETDSDAEQRQDHATSSRAQSSN